jgi:hypothetical protein
MNAQVLQLQDVGVLIAIVFLPFRVAASKVKIFTKQTTLNLKQT